MTCPRCARQHTSRYRVSLDTVTPRQCATHNATTPHATHGSVAASRKCLVAPSTSKHTCCSARTHSGVRVQLAPHRVQRCTYSTLVHGSYATVAHDCRPADEQTPVALPIIAPRRSVSRPRAPHQATASTHPHFVHVLHITEQQGPLRHLVLGCSPEVAQQRSANRASKCASRRAQPLHARTSHTNVTHWFS